MNLLKVYSLEKVSDQMTVQVNKYSLGREYYCYFVSLKKKFLNVEQTLNVSKIPLKSTYFGKMSIDEL